jgi:hypothetical protein
MIERWENTKKKNGIKHYSNIPVFDSNFADTNHAGLPGGSDTVTVS